MTESSEETEKKSKEELPPTWTLWTAGSYAFVMLLIGLPLWWNTTAVQRVPLPYEDMHTLTTQLQSEFLIKVPVNLFGFSKQLTPEDETRFKNIEGYSFKFEYAKSGALEMDALYKTSNIYGMDKEMCKLEAAQKIDGDVYPLNIYYVGRADLLKEFGQKVIIGNCRSVYYISNLSKVNYDLLSETLRKISGLTKDSGSIVDVSKAGDEIEEELQLPLSAGYNILLSLLVPEPEYMQSRWDIVTSIEAYLDPMLKKMKSFAEFSIRSQVLHYIRLNVYPVWNSERKHHEIPYDQLPLVINPVESKLTSFVSQNPVLNFLTYTAPCSKSPLKILENDGSPLPSNAFLVPQWGGIFIYNAHSPCTNEPNTTTPSHGQTHEVQTDLVMSVMISQFRSLIGLPEITDDDILDFRGSVLRDWEVDMIVRKRLKQLIFTAANTLKSLGQLLDEITNIVVTEEVGDQVERSVSSIKSAIKEAAQGKLSFAQSHAIEAFKASEIAFHHPKNLKQLYFPDDQKYAIYIPLFLPVGIPVLLSLRVIFLRLLSSRRGVDKVKAD